MNAHKVDLKAVTINTSKIEPMVEFYQNLGFGLERKNSTGTTEIYRSQNGDFEFTIFAVKEKTVTPVPTLQMTLAVRDLDSIISKLSKNERCRIILDPILLADGYKAIVLDPDGNSVELIQKED